MRINTLFIRCLSAEPVFECFTPSMNGAAWGYTTFSSVFRELWSPRHLNTWIKAIKRLWRALRDDYAKPYADLFLLFKFSSCSLTALYEASMSKYLFHDIFEPIGCLKCSCWNKGEVGHRFIQSTVRLDLLFFLFPTECRVVLHCGKSQLGRRRLPFKHAYGIVRDCN